MKKQIKLTTARIIEFTFTLAALVLVLTILPSCINTNPEKSKEVAENHNVVNQISANKEDAKFLLTAAEINLEEIYLAKLGQNNSSCLEVKNLCKMMEAAHSKVYWELKTIASKKQVTIPTMLVDNGRETDKKLIDKSGSKFDKDCCDMILENHKFVLAQFQTASLSSSDKDIRNWASSMLPTLRSHFDNSLICQSEIEKK